MSQIVKTRTLEDIVKKAGILYYGGNTTIIVPLSKIAIVPEEEQSSIFKRLFSATLKKIVTTTDNLKDLKQIIEEEAAQNDKVFIQDATMNILYDKVYIDIENLLDSAAIATIDDESIELDNVVITKSAIEYHGAGMVGTSVLVDDKTFEKIKNIVLAYPEFVERS